MSGSGKTCSKFFITLLLLFLLPCADACSSGDNEAPTDRESSAKAAPANVASGLSEERNTGKDGLQENSIPDIPATASQIDKPILDQHIADKIMAFNNHALERLQNDWRNPAEMFYNLGHIYLRIFKIPDQIDPPARKRGDLIPPKGLFDDKEAQALFQAMDNMDKALASSLTHFGQLKKYVLDPAIQDNGRNGRKIVGMLEQDYKAFRKACKAWEEILAKKVDAAEEALLADHPLRRQALAASSIMRIISAVSVEINANEVDRQKLSGAALRIGSLIARAEKPPFPARPALERLFRIFLNNSSIYSSALGRAALEGVYDIQKRELALAGRACSDSYNDFVAAFNENAVSHKVNLSGAGKN